MERREEAANLAIPSWLGMEKRTGTEKRSKRRVKEGKEEMRSRRETREIFRNQTARRNSPQSQMRQGLGFAPKYEPDPGLGRVESRDGVDIARPVCIKLVVTV